MLITTIGKNNYFEYIDSEQHADLWKIAQFLFLGTAKKMLSKLPRVAGKQSLRNTADTSCKENLSADTTLSPQ
jgi:hypothetical protein